MKGATPAIVQLERAGESFVVHEFEHDPSSRNFGLEAAVALGVGPERVFKTLLANVVAEAGTSTVVGIVPVSGQLSMRGLAAAVGAKRAEMCPPEVAQRVTGYVVGGISPFGQKKRLTTVVDETCVVQDSVFVSGGRRGLDLEVHYEVLVRVLDALVAPIGA